MTPRFLVMTSPTRHPIVMCFVLLCTACFGQAPSNVGLMNNRFTPCPSTPNCVSSDATDPEHAIPPYELLVPAPEAWRVLRAVIQARARTRVLAAGDDYIHAECRSLVFRFVDDIEFHLRPGAGVIAVKSASRVGQSDLGVNRRRVEGIRSELRSRGAVR